MEIAGPLLVAYVGRNREPSALRTVRMVDVRSSELSAIGAVRSLRLAKMRRLEGSGRRLACGPSAAGSGGRSTAPGTFPAMARIRRRDGASFTTMSQ